MMSSAATLLVPYKYILWVWYIFEDQTLEVTHELLHQHYPEVELLQHCPANSPLASAYPSVRTLSRIFNYWNYGKRELVILTPAVRQAIQERLGALFYQLALSDEEIMLFLNAEGFNITLRS